MVAFTGVLVQNSLVVVVCVVHLLVMMHMLLLFFVELLLLNNFLMDWLLFIVKFIMVFMRLMHLFPLFEIDFLLDYLFLFQLFFMMLVLMDFFTVHLLCMLLVLLLSHDLFLLLNNLLHLGDLLDLLGRNWLDWFGLDLLLRRGMQGVACRLVAFFVVRGSSYLLRIDYLRVSEGRVSLFLLGSDLGAVNAES